MPGSAAPPAPARDNARRVTAIETRFRACARAQGVRRLWRDVLERAGIIKTKVPLKGLKQPEKLVKETKPQTKAQQRYSRLTGDANRPNGRVERVQRTAKMECNLLGLTVDEALPEVDSFIDRAILNGQTVVYLIHGNGTGALRTAIHKHLRGNRMVKSFRLGRYGEGESGVTVVELK